MLLVIASLLDNNSHTHFLGLPRLVGKEQVNEIATMNNLPHKLNQ